MSQSQNNNGNYKYKDKLVEVKLPELRLPEGKTDTNTGSAREAVKIGGLLAKAIQTIGFVGTLATATYFGGSSDNSKGNDASDKSDPAQERYDNHLAKNKAIKDEKLKQGCQPLTDEEEHMLQSIEDLFATDDTTNHILAWELFKSLTFKDRITKIGVADKYTDSLIIENTQSNICKCLGELDVVDLSTNDNDNRESLWFKIKEKLNNRDYIITFPNLKELQLNSLSDTTQFPVEILGIKSLENLDVSDNKLESIPSQISLLSNLQYLYLSRNKLESIPDQINSLRYLKELDVSANQLKSILNQISSLRYLTFLDVSGDQLTEDEKQELKDKFGDIISL